MMHKNEEYRLNISILKKDNEKHIKALELCEINKTIVNEPKNLKGNHTLKTSILSQYAGYEHESLDYFLCSWLEDSINLFKSFKYAIELGIANSISPNKMVEIELNKLNKFFESGLYESKAYHSKLVTKGLYELYSSLLYGEPWVLISIDELLGFQDILNNQDIENKADFFKAKMQDNLKLEWWLSIRLQVLLWLNDYLEKLKDKNFTDIHKKHKRKKPFDDLVQVKKGFQVKNKEIIIPALHKALLNNDLIAEISENNFDKAFLNGEGFIEWTDTGTCLAYLLNELQDNEIISTVSFWKESENIFKFRGKHSSLKGSVEKVANTKKIIIEKIIKTLTLLLQ